MQRWWIVCLGILLATAAHAAPVASTGNGPIEISAERLEASDVAKSLVFIGNAVAKQGDVTISGDRLTISYKGDGGDVDRVLAEGNVRIVQKGRVATGGRVEFFRAEERMVLTGSPRISEGSNAIQGEEIILFLKENRSEVRGGQSGRVNAVFQPQSGGGR